MKKVSTFFSALLAAAALLLAVAIIAAAADRPAVTGDINKLNAEISQINKDAKVPQGERIVAKKIADDFNVSIDRINVLLGGMMQYGDAAAVLAFAEKLPGGISNQNVNKVMDMRSKAAWDKVAQNLRIDPGSVAGRLSSVEDGIQTALAESYDRGRAAGGVDQSSEEPGSQKY